MGSQFIKLGIVCRGQDRSVVVRDATKVCVGDVEEGPGLLTGEGVFLVVTRQSLLVEEGSVTAHEGEVGCLNQGADLVSDGQADVEKLRGGFRQSNF